MKKRLLSLMVVAAMSASLVACGSSEGGSSDGASGSGVSITVLNSKTEIQTQFEEMAEAYEEATGVHVEVYNADTDTTVASQVATKYASNDPYTLTMVDAKDIYSLADDYAYDLSNEDWASHTTLGITVNDKLAGFPVCVEARGIIYNADAIEAITGETFDPSSVATLDDFQALLDELKAGGMETPVGVLSEYWSLGAHYFAEVYEQQEDPDAFVNSLLAGEADLGSNEKFNELMDTFDTLIAYNYAKGSAANADREESSMMLAQGDIAFMFGGNWDWSVINQYDYTENMGIMPVPENTSDDTNTKLVGGGSKYFFVDSSDATSDEQRQAALDPLSLSVKSYADAGKLIPNYNYLPDDHMTVVGQEIMQKYLDEAMTRDELVTAVEEYFKTATPIEH